MEKIVLKSLKRDLSEALRELRASRNVPAVVYGHKQEPISIKLWSSDVLKAYRVAWWNSVVSLDVEWKKIDVLFHQIQKNPVTWDITHIDFYAITAWEKITTHIPLVFVWISKAKLDEWAIIEEVLKQVEVRCLSSDLINHFEVDLSKLEKIWDNIKISDLGISSKYDLITHIEEVVAVAAKPKVEVISEDAPEAKLPEDPKAAKEVKETK